MKLLAMATLVPWLLLAISRPKAATAGAAATSGVVSIGVWLGFTLVPSYLFVMAALPTAASAIISRSIRLTRVDALIIGFAVSYLMITLLTYGNAPPTPDIGAVGRNSPEIRPLAQSLALVAMIATYFVARVHIDTIAALQGVLKWWRVGGAFVLAYAYYQPLAFRYQLPLGFVNARRDASLVPIESGIVRVNSTLTEPTTLAQFLVILLAVHWSTDLLGGRRPSAPYTMAVVGALALTASRAGLLGFLVFMMVAGALSVLVKPGWGARKRRPGRRGGLRLPPRLHQFSLLPTVLASAVALVAFLSATPTGALLIGRFGAIAGGSEAYVRAGYWHAALDIFRHHPWGVGIGNYTYYYFSHLPSSALHQVVYEVTDAHNVFLDYLVEGGVITLSAYVAAMATLIARILRVARAPMVPPGLRQALVLLSAALIAALLMQMTFSYFYLPYIWLLTGVLAACTSTSHAWSDDC